MENNRYLYWQEQLKARRLYRYFWVFCGIYSILALFGIGFYLLIYGQWRPVALVLIVFVIARAIISPLIFLIYKRQRPYQKYNFFTTYSWLLSRRTGKFTSFPSDHAMSVAAICFVLWHFYPVLGPFFLLLVILNGWARVVLGYHYWTDVLAGWILGVLCGWLVILTLAPMLIK